MQNGFVRLWIVASVLWAGWVTWSQWQNIQKDWYEASYRTPTQAEIAADAAEKGDCHKAIELGSKAKDLSLRNDWWKCDPIVGMKRDHIDWSAFLPVAILMLVPIFGFLLLGIAVAWVAAGFRAQR